MPTSVTSQRFSAAAFDQRYVLLALESDAVAVTYVDSRTVGVIQNSEHDCELSVCGAELELLPRQHQYLLSC